MSNKPKHKRLREQVAKVARYRCGYCLCREDVIGLELELDHIDPQANGGKTVRENLWLACGPCNKHKSSRRRITDAESGSAVRLFNPRTDDWFVHFCWIEAGERIEGLTAIGRAMVEALQLNEPITRIVARRNWITAGWHPPGD